MRIFAGLIPFLLLLAACTPAPVWVKQGASEAQRQRDQSYCNGAAENARSYAMNHRSAAVQESHRAFQSCMYDRGYRPEQRG